MFMEWQCTPRLRFSPESESGGPCPVAPGFLAASPGLAFAFHDDDQGRREGLRHHEK
jgi:hypothetical protein